MKILPFLFLLVACHPDIKCEPAIKIVEVYIPTYKPIPRPIEISRPKVLDLDWMNADSDIHEKTLMTLIQLSEYSKQLELALQPYKDIAKQQEEK